MSSIRRVSVRMEGWADREWDTENVAELVAEVRQRFNVVAVLHPERHEQGALAEL